ncbi:Importin-11 [Perkinsus olseni]|uniref:Importin-11 n=1 Tax=Perkinsus olseni TaxID=32597 RepID=A0A7J6SJN7_PEROL|nr:Importin-11 [Perkinsus olseni]
MDSRGAEVPLSPSNVVAALNASLSTDAVMRGMAVQQLQRWETASGYALMLLDIYLDATTDTQSKFLAITMCKNTVGRNWQPRSSHCISQGEREHFKQKLVGVLYNADPARIEHLAEFVLLLRKVCRAEFPAKWPDMVNWTTSSMKSLASNLTSVPREQVLALLKIVHGVVKEQQTKKLLSARKQTFEIAPHILEGLLPIWQHFSSATSDWELCRILDGTTLILLCIGFQKLYLVPSGLSIVSSVFQRLALVVNAYPQNYKDPYYEKDLKTLLKWFSQIVHTHPLALADCGVDKMLMAVLAPGSGWIHQRNMPDFFPRYLINIVQYCMNCTAFRKGISNVTASETGDEQMRQKLISSLHPQFINFITNTGGLGPAVVEPVINAGLCVDEESLREWIEDAEQYLTGPPCVATDLRLATEACLLAAQQEPFTQALAEYVAAAANGLVESIGQLMGSSPPSATMSAIRCDAVVSLLNLYHTILRKFSENETDPNRKYASVLVDRIAVPILQLPTAQPYVALLKYRVIMLLRTWAGELASSQRVEASVQAIGRCLESNQEHPGVKFQAVLSLRSIFDRDPEHPVWVADGLLPNIISRAMDMLGTSGGVNVPEAQWRLLTAVTSFVNDSELSDSLQMPLLQKLVNLWRSPSTDELVKFALLDLVKGLLANYYSASTYSIGKDLKVYPALVECGLTIALDASGFVAGQAPYSPSSTGSSPTCSPLRVGRAQPSPPPPSPVNQATVMGALSATQGACSTIRESGLSLLVSVLRAVRGQDQVTRVLPLFPQCLARFSPEIVESPELNEVDIDLITEFVALHLLPEYNPNAVEAVKTNPRGQFSAQGGEALSVHYETITRGIKQHIQHRIDLYSQDSEMNAPKAADDRLADKVFRLVRILLVVDERLVEQIVFPLYQHFLGCFPSSSARSANGPNSSPLYPFREEPLLMTFATAAAHHPQKFLSLAAAGGLEAAAVGAQKIMGLMRADQSSTSPAWRSYLLPSVSQRCLVLAVPMMLLSAVADSRLIGPEAQALWVSLWNQVESSQAKSGGASGVSGLLSSTLRELRSKVPSHAKTPYPYRVSACMIASSLPPSVPHAQDQDMLEWLLKVAVGIVTSFDQRVGNGAGKTLLGFIESDRLTQKRLSVWELPQLPTTLDPREQAMREADGAVIRAEGIQEAEPSATAVPLHVWERMLFRREHIRRCISDLKSRGTRPEKRVLDELRTFYSELLTVLLGYKFKIFCHTPELMLRGMLRGVRFVEASSGDHIWREDREAAQAYLVLARSKEAQLRVVKGHRTVGLLEPASCAEPMRKLHMSSAVVTGCSPRAKVLIAAIHIGKYLKPSRQMNGSFQWQAILSSVRRSQPFHELSLPLKDVVMFTESCERLVVRKGCRLNLPTECFFMVIAGCIRAMVFIDHKEVPVWEIRRRGMWADGIGAAAESIIRVSHFVAHAEGETQVLWMPRETFLSMLLEKMNNLRYWFLMHNKVVTNAIEDNLHSSFELIERPDFHRKSVAYMGLISDKVSRSADVSQEVLELTRDSAE